ncbi:hypothetical protein HYZ64_01020 [Candidatus Berkelbacteria bacterium]|nr:hypothetical protein [Candidatus Berkelbacteria bacterium]
MINQLITKLKQGKGAHGYLLVGEPGEAKHFFDELARGLAIHPADRLMIDSPEISIDEARGLIKRLIVRPFGASGKLAFIAGKLWGEAAAALLKIVEEPPGGTLIFFQAKHVDDIPVTLASRLEKVRLGGAASPMSNYPDPKQLSAMPLKEKFALARTVAEQKQVGELIDSILVALRDNLVYDEPTQRLIEECLAAKRQLAYNINARLLLENLLVKISN